MANIEVRGVSEVKKALATLKGQLPFASALAQTRMAARIWNAEKEQMTKDFDRPKPWSLGALRYQKATTTGQKAKVDFKDRFGQTNGLGAGDYLGVQILGGVRSTKRASEQIFQRIGILKEGWTWVPARGVKLDRYGNVAARTLGSIVKELGANPFQYRRGAQFSVMRKGSQAIGIRALIAGEWFPYLWFVKAPTYGDRFKFYERADLEVEKHFVNELDKAVDFAIATAK